jgi:uncharacterized protein involved in exopolysaccharide biosynthesis
MATDMEGMRQQITSMESRQSDMDTRLTDVTKKVASNSQLKPVLRQIKQTATSLEGTRARIQLILQRNSQSLGGADTAQAHELAMIQSTEAELINTIRDLREEAREIAAEEHFELSDTQLRNDV